LQDAGRHEEALAAFVRLASMEPADAAIHYNLGLSLMYTNRHSEAINSFSRSIQLDPSNAYAYNMLGEVMRKSGQVL